MDREDKLEIHLIVFFLFIFVIFLKSVFVFLMILYRLMNYSKYGDLILVYLLTSSLEK